MGIEGRPNDGVAQRVDFAPRLELEARVLDQWTRGLIAEKKIPSAGLEFVPLEVETRNDHAVVAPAFTKRTVTDPEQVRQVAWLPHHDERHYPVD